MAKRSRMIRSTRHISGYSTHECLLNLKVDADGVPHLLIQTAFESFEIPSYDVLIALRPWVTGFLMKQVVEAFPND